MANYVPNKRNLAIAIRENYNAGMKAKEIAELFQISKQRVNYWLHTPIRKKIRRRKLSRNEINMIVKWAKDKPIIECNVSAKNIQNKYNKLPKRLKEKKRQKKISLSTANRILNKYIGKPKVLRKVFYLKKEERQLRLNFLKYMRDKNISPEDLFFTDESIFPLKVYSNRGTNKIRLCKKTQKKIKSGDERAINLRIRPQKKFNKGVMVIHI